jgi:hypothetical protein
MPVALSGEDARGLGGRRDFSRWDNRRRRGAEEEVLGKNNVLRALLDAPYRSGRFECPLSVRQARNTGQKSLFEFSSCSRRKARSAW